VQTSTVTPPLGPVQGLEPLADGAASTSAESEGPVVGPGLYNPMFNITAGKTHKMDFGSDLEFMTAGISTDDDLQQSTGRQPAPGRLPVTNIREILHYGRNPGYPVPREGTRVFRLPGNSMGGL